MPALPWFGIHTRFYVPELPYLTVWANPSHGRPAILLRLHYTSAYMPLSQTRNNDHFYLLERRTDVAKK